jgi:hypothetical protein
MRRDRTSQEYPPVPVEESSLLDSFCLDKGDQNCDDNAYSC